MERERDKPDGKEREKEREINEMGKGELEREREREINETGKGRDKRDGKGRVG